MQPVIQARSLEKDYGLIRALRGVSLDVHPGETFGLLGQNGAGKTTLIKLLLGIASPTSGTGSVLGLPLGSAEARRRIGYLPEDHRFPDYHTAASLLDFYGALLDFPSRQRRRRIPEVLEMVGLEGRMNSKIRTYSKGMKQRLGIAQAILHEPLLVFLDEPTDGVDPVGRREIRTLLARLKEQGMTVFVNSHLLGEVELMCGRVAILSRGELIRQGPIAELTRLRGTYVIGLDSADLPAEEVRRMGYTVSRAGPFHEVTVTAGQEIDPVIRLIVDRGLKLRHLVEKRQTLEDLFVEAVEGSDRAPPATRQAFPLRAGPSEGIQT